MDQLEDKQVGLQRRRRGTGKGCHFYMVCGQSSYDGIKGRVYNYCRDLVQLETWNTAAPVAHMPGL